MRPRGVRGEGQQTPFFEHDDLRQEHRVLRGRRRHGFHERSEVLTFDHYDSEIAEAMLRGTLNAPGGRGGGLPAFLQIDTTSVEPGRLSCGLPVTEALLNPFGAAHGGVVSALIDHALGAVCFPVIRRGSWPATQEFKINFLAPARVGRMEAEAQIVNMSKRTAVVRIDVTNGGRLVCAAQGTVAIMPPKSEPGGGPTP